MVPDLAHVGFTPATPLPNQGFPARFLDVNEAYTSKTRSWDGTVNTKLGGAKAIRDETGFGMDRDVNGARGIFLRALGDSPFLRGLLTQVASQATASA